MEKCEFCEKCDVWKNVNCGKCEFCEKCELWKNMWFFKNVNFTGDINDRAWCSTSTDQDHTHQAGSNTWGYCDPELC